MKFILAQRTSVTHALSEAAQNLRSAQPLKEENSVSLQQFEDIVEMNHWKKIEERFTSK